MGVELNLGKQGKYLWVPLRTTHDLQAEARGGVPLHREQEVVARRPAAVQPVLGGLALLDEGLDLVGRAELAPLQVLQLGQHRRCAGLSKPYTAKTMVS